MWQILNVVIGCKVTGLGEWDSLLAIECFGGGQLSVKDCVQVSQLSGAWIVF